MKKIKKAAERAIKTVEIGAVAYKTFQDEMEIK